MRRIVAVAVFSSVVACIEWPSDEEIRRSRCAATPTDMGCVVADAGVDSGVVDSGVVDSGVVDSGVVDSGVDAGIDSGVWPVRWVNALPFEPLFLVGGGDRGTLVGFSSAGGAALRLQSLNSSGPNDDDFAYPGNRPTAAYQTNDTVVVAREDSSVVVFRRAPTPPYQPGPTVSLPFVTTAIDLYPFEPDGGLAAAAYGDLGGSLGVASFTMNGADAGSAYVQCSTSVLRPQRIVPSPNAGPGIVAGNLTGSCTTPGFATISDAGGGFIGRFGGTIPTANGYSFFADPDSPTVLGVVGNDVLVAYRPPGGASLYLARVADSVSLNDPRPILIGTSLTPVDIVDIPGPDFLVVGYGNGAVSQTDGGITVSTDGDDLFVARLDEVGRNVSDWFVVRGGGDQTAVGAIWLDAGLVIGGACAANSVDSFCVDAGAYVLGMEVP